jgi:cytoskeletal protein CcmA (bactofilin family)
MVKNLNTIDRSERVRLGKWTADHQPENTVVLNATGEMFPMVTANSFYVAPLRYDLGQRTSSNTIVYNYSTKEIVDIGPGSISGLDEVLVSSNVSIYPMKLVNNVTGLVTTSNVGVGNTNPIHLLDVGDNFYVTRSGNVSIGGDLTVTGNTTIDAHTLKIKDSILEIGSDNTLGVNDLGLSLTRPGAASNVAMVFDERSNVLSFGYSDTAAQSNVIAFSNNSSNGMSMRVYGDFSVNEWKMMQTDGITNTINYADNTASITAPAKGIFTVTVTSGNAGYGNTYEVKLNGTRILLLNDDNMGPVSITRQLMKGDVITIIPTGFGFTFSNFKFVYTDTIFSLMNENKTNTFVVYDQSRVGILKSVPTHTLDVGSNLYVDDSGSNVLGVTGNTFISGELDVIGNVSISSNLSLAGDVTSNLDILGNVSVGREVSITGNTVVTGNITTSNNLTVAGGAVITGNIVTSSNLTVSGNAEISGNIITNKITSNTLNVSDEIEIGSNLTIGGNLITTEYLTVGKDANIAGNTVTTSNLIANKDVDIFGNTVISGNLTTSYHTTLHKNANIYGNLITTGNLTVSNNLTVTRETEISGNLETTGNITTSSNLTVSQNARISGNATVTGNLVCMGHIVLGNLTVNKDSTVTGNLLSHGNITTSYNLTVAKDATITGNLETTGNITGDYNLTIAKDAAITGNLATTANISTDYNLTVAKEATITGNLATDGNITTSSNLTVAKDATVTGNLTATGNISTAYNLTVEKEATITGNLVTDGNITTSSNLTVSKDATVTGNLATTGNISTAYNLTVAKDTEITGNLETTGNIEGAYNLTVAKDAAITGNLITTGNVSTSYNLTVAKDAAVTGNLETTGNITGSYNLTVAKDASVAGNLTVTKDATVTGNLTATANIGTDYNLTVAKDAAITGNLTTTGNVSTAYNLTVSKDAAVTGNLETTGNISTAYNLTVAKDAAVTGNLTTTANIGTDYNLTVAKDAAVTGNLETTGNISTAYNLTVAKDTSITGNIVTDGNITTSKSLTVSGNVDISGNVSISGNLIHDGKTTVINSENVIVKDPITLLGNGFSSDTIDFGHIMKRDGSNVVSGYMGDERKYVIAYTESTGLTPHIVPTAETMNVHVYGKVFTESNVGIMNTEPTHQLSIGNNIFADNGRVSATEFSGDGGLLSNIATTLQSISDQGNVTSNTIQFTNAKTGFVVSSNAIITGNLTASNVGIANALPTHQLSIGTNVFIRDGTIEATQFDGDGGLLSNITTTLQSVSDHGNVTSNTIQFTNAKTGFIVSSNADISGNLTASNVGIANALPTHQLSIGTNVFIRDGTIEATQFDGDGGLLSNIATTLQSISDQGNVTSNTIQFTNAKTGFVVSSNADITGNLTASNVGIANALPTHQLSIGTNVFIRDGTIEATQFDGDGGLLSNIATTLQSITDQGNVTSNTIQFTNTDVGFITTANVGIANSAPDHSLAVGSNLYIDEFGSNVLVINGNVATEKITLGNVAVSAVYTLSHIANRGNVTSNTIQFTNPNVALTATGNVEIGTGSLYKGDGGVLSNVSAGALGSAVTMTSTDTSSLAGPEFTLYRNSASAANNDYLGQLKFSGKNANGNTKIYAKMTAKANDVTTDAEKGLFEFAIRKAGSLNICARLTSTDLKLQNGTGLEVQGNTTIGESAGGSAFKSIRAVTVSIGGSSTTRFSQTAFTYGHTYSNAAKLIFSVTITNTADEQLTLYPTITNKGTSGAKLNIRNLTNTDCSSSANWNVSTARAEIIIYELP